MTFKIFEKYKVIHGFIYSVYFNAPKTYCSIDFIFELERVLQASFVSKFYIFISLKKWN